MTTAGSLNSRATFFILGNKIRGNEEAIKNIRSKGNEIGIITWLPKNSTEEYKKEVTKAKLFWLKKYLPSINFNEIIIVDYGTPKKNYCKSKEDWLFDDEINNRNNWDGYAFEVNNILTALKAI